MPEQQHDQPLPQLPPATLHPSPSHQPFGKKIKKKKGFTFKERRQDSGPTNRNQEKAKTSRSFTPPPYGKGHAAGSARLAASTRAWKSECWCLCILYPSLHESHHRLIIGTTCGTPGCSYFTLIYGAEGSQQTPCPGCSR